MLLCSIYIIQLVLFQSKTHNSDIYASNYSKDDKEFITSINIVLLVTSATILMCSWISDITFDSLIVLIDSVLFGSEIGWLVLSIPENSYEWIMYIINISICLFLFVSDLYQHMPSNAFSQFRLKYFRFLPTRIHRPSIRLPNLPRNGSKGSLSSTDSKKNKYMKFNALNEYSSVNENANGVQSGSHSVEMIGLASNTIKDVETGSVGNGSSDSQEDVSNSTLSLTGPTCMIQTKDTPHLNQVHQIKSNKPKKLNIQLNPAELNMTKKGPIFEGFRVILDRLPLDDDIPRDLTWNNFSQIEHKVDSSSCHIYTAFWKDINSLVILKLIKAERTTSAVAVAEFETEENVLSRISHPNIIKLLGSGSKPRKFLVLELLSGGTLANTLGLDQDSNQTNWKKKLPLIESLRIAYSLSSALSYLHSDWNNAIHLIHRDLKPDNIGWDEFGQLKLFDFGLCASVRAQREKTEQYKLTGNTGTLRYMAPEVVLGRSYHKSVDTYSFGILVWQVTSGKVPFKEMGKKTFFDRVVVGGQRPQLDPKWPPAFCNLLKKSWHEDKNARPDFHFITNELDKLIKETEENIEKKQNKSWPILDSNQPSLLSSSILKNHHEKIVGNNSADDVTPLNSHLHKKNSFDIESNINNQHNHDTNKGIVELMNNPMGKNGINLSTSDDILYNKPAIRRNISNNNHTTKSKQLINNNNNNNNINPNSPEFVAFNPLNDNIA
eukprot:gene13912-18655_t